MRRLTGTDTLMLYTDTGRSQNIFAPLGFYALPEERDGRPLTLEEILDYVGARLHLVSAFQERLVRVPFGLDRPVWIRDADFDLEYHVRHTAVPRPGTWEQLSHLISRIGQLPLDLSRPPWELYVIDGLDAIEGLPRGTFAALLKMHHAAVDGVEGMRIWNVLHETTPDAEPPAPIAETAKGEEAPSELGMVARAAVHAVTNPVGAVRRMAIPTLRTAPGALLRSIFDSEARAQSGLSLAGGTRFNGPVGPHRVWDAYRFTLADAKAVKDAVPGASVNDVVLTIVGGGLRSYLGDIGELPDFPLKAIMPISMRGTPTRSTDSTTVAAGRGGNSFSMATVPLGTDVADALERLRTIRERTRAAKDYAMSAPALVEWSDALPGALMGTASKAVLRLINRAGRTLAVHTTVTNVPGPAQPLYFCGAQLALSAGFAPVLDGMGLIHGVTSCNGQMAVSFTADRDMLPDPERYTAALSNSFDELKKAAGVD
jgi:diacylglycerol O-acyltransferase / wax synthase